MRIAGNIFRDLSTAKSAKSIINRNRPTYAAYNVQLEFHESDEFFLMSLLITRTVDALSIAAIANARPFSTRVLSCCASKQIVTTRATRRRIFRMRHSARPQRQRGVERARGRRRFYTRAWLYGRADHASAPRALEKWNASSARQRARNRVAFQRGYRFPLRPIKCGLTHVR